MRKPKESPALTIMRLLYKHAWDVGGQSWQRLNQSLRSVLCNLIVAGVEFSENDFATIYLDMKGGYWFGTDASGMGESIYALACELNHTGACRSFEKWKDRPAFILDGNRIAEGSYVDIGDGVRWVATSFKDTDTINLTLTKRDDSGRSKVMRRRKLTREQIKARNAELREARKPPKKQEDAA